MRHPLGPFELVGRLGSGGMGTVYEAVHVREEVAAAIKILDPGSVRPDTFRADFRDEVRAVAALDHPHIVMVLDYGEVTEAEAHDSDGELVAGMPYLAMEHVAGASLSRVRGRLGWDSVRTILLQVLDALAHAHAAGVVHRDIKPGNVLWDGHTAKLVDFGIAHIDAGAAEPAGTPAYMSPEQFSADWRDLSPATDLYAVGCLAWVLCTGNRPFQVHGFAALREAHCTEPPGRLLARWPVPDGFEGWVKRLLRKSPWERFQRAADAAWALHGLGDPPRRESLPETLAPDNELATLVLDASMLSSQPTRLLPGSGEVAAGGRFLAPLPPFPRRWQRAEQPGRSLPLLGAGLGLFGLRRIPLVGRTAERDVLWGALRTTQRAGRPRAILLQGPSGCGKSRLAAWLGQRAHEVGAASVLTAVHGADGGAADGIVPMLARFLRCVGLDGSALSARLTRLAPSLGIDEPEEVETLRRLLESGLERREARTAAVVALLRRLCAERPVILLLDDLQWGSEALALVEALLASERQGLPVLVVGTVRAEALVEAPEAAQRLEAVATHEAGTRLALDALGEADRVALVRSLLRLEPGLAAEVVRRTDGNPLFAVQLVGDWVQRGLLDHGENGFRLASGAEAAFPDDLHAVWSERIERALAGRPAEQGQALELAAVLGQVVVAAEWAGACAAAGLPAEPELVEALIEARLARPALAGAEPGWRFVHAMLRESLVRCGVEEGRGVAWHAAAARALTDLGVDDPDRIGTHLLEAGRIAEAVPVLFRAELRHRHRGELDRAWAVLQQLRGVLDPRDVQLRLAEGWVLSLRRQTAEALSAFEEALALAELGGEQSSLQDACFALGICAKLAGRMADSRRLLERAVALAETLKAPLRHANALMALGSTLAMMGELERGHVLVEEACAIQERLGDEKGMLQSLFTLAGNAGARGDHAEARRLSERGLALSRTRRDPYSVIGFEGLLGDVARHEGRLEDAREHYEACRRVELQVGRERAPITELNLALLEVAAGRFAAARRALERLLPLVETTGRRGLAGAVRVVLLPCLAHFRAWEAFDTVLARAVEDLAATGLVERDVAAMADLAATVAREAGQPARAEAVAALAARHWAALRS